MFFSGFTLAVLTGAGFWMIYRKMPPSVRGFMQRHILLTDAIACALTYMLFGGTLVALFAAAWMGIMVSGLLTASADPRISAIMEHYTKKMTDLIKRAIDWLAKQTPEKEEENKLKVV